MEQLPTVHNCAKTILLVEEDQGTLKTIRELLTGYSFNVLAAMNKHDALRQSRDYGGEIDLLLLDSAIFRANGLNLEEQLSLERPKIKTLLLSGSKDVTNIQEKWLLLPKRHLPAELGELILYVLRCQSAPESLQDNCFIATGPS